MPIEDTSVEWSESDAPFQTVATVSIPPQDFDELYAAGADAIYPPGTIIPESAVDLLEKLLAQLDD